MVILIFIFILFLLGAVLPLVLEIVFSFDELIEMGVYVEDFQSNITSHEDLNSSPSGSLRSCAGLAA